MDDAPYTDDLDPASVTTHEELTGLLQTVHLRADKPSLRTLEARTRHSPTPLSETAVAEMLRGTRLPRKSFMVAFLRACGIPDDRIEPWQRVGANRRPRIRADQLFDSPKTDPGTHLADGT